MLTLCSCITYDVRGEHTTTYVTIVRQFLNVRDAVELEFDQAIYDMIPAAS